MTCAGVVTVRGLPRIEPRVFLSFAVCTAASAVLFFFLAITRPRPIWLIIRCISLNWFKRRLTSEVVDPLPFGLELAMPVQLQKAYANLWIGEIVAGAPIPGGLPPGSVTR